MSRIAGLKNIAPENISPDKIIAILNNAAEPDEERIPEEREVSIISSTPTHYHFITKHHSDSRLIYTNVYFLGKRVKKPRMEKAGMVFLESTLLKLLDLYRKSSDVFKSEIQESIKPVSTNKKLTVDINLHNRFGSFCIHAFFDFEDERLDIKKVKMDENTGNEFLLKNPQMLIKINSEENYIVDDNGKTLCFRKKIFITANN